MTRKEKTEIAVACEQLIADVPEPRRIRARRCHLLPASLLACRFGACEIELVAASAFRRANRSKTACDVGREALARWYDLGKVARWSARGAASVPDDRRGRYVQ